MMGSWIIIIIQEGSEGEYVNGCIENRKWSEIVQLQLNYSALYCCNVICTEQFISGV